MTLVKMHELSDLVRLATLDARRPPSRRDSCKTERAYSTRPRRLASRQLLHPDFGPEMSPLEMKFGVCVDMKIN